MNEPPTPLELLKCSFYNQAKGEIEELSALDSKFCQDVHFPRYHPAPKTLPETDPCIWQNWVESLSTSEKNLSWLLKLPHAKYWCQVVNNVSLQAFLDSYLKQSPRFQSSEWPNDAQEVHNSVHKLVFMVYIRMAANKESTKNFMTPDFFGELIYDNYLFDIPKIMDLCAIYGNKTNSVILGKAISNVFKCQPSYNDDLGKSVETIMQTFHSIDDRCGIDNSPEPNLESSSPRRPHRISEGPENKDLMELTLQQFEDIVLFACDACFTLKRFLDVCPSFCSVFYGNVKYLIKFYSSSLTLLKESFRERSIDDLHLRSQLLAHVKIARDSLLNIIRQIVNEHLLTPAKRASEIRDMNRVESLADEYFHLLSEFLGNSTFFQDYLRKLPVLEDVQSLLQVSPGVDDTRASFILGSLGAGKSPRVANAVPESLMNGTASKSSPPLPSNSFATVDVTATAPSQRSGANDSEMISLISAVRDVLPQLEEKYVESCLIYFKRDCEKTIHALLEGNVPDDVQQQEKLIMQQNNENLDTREGNVSPVNESFVESAVLKERRNVFDSDEFDVYKAENIDFSKIHQGKKTKISVENVVPTPEMRQMYEKYSMVSDEEEITEGMSSVFVDDCNMYDDEYDDMYDGLGVDANDADDTDEILSRRPFVTPRVFLQGKKGNSPESQPSSEEESPSGPKPDHFVANPAELREKQEARRRQQQELRNNRRGGNKGQRPGQNSGANSNNQDRKKKDMNKAKVANHSRKKMAARKASKGMGPV